MELGTLGAALADGIQGTFSGDLYRPGDDGYDDARHVINKMIARSPALVGRPADEAGLTARVNLARERGLPLAVRCGGHGVSGHGTCDGGIVLELGAFKKVDIDPAGKIVRAGAGLMWGDLDAATQEHGLAVTGGRVSTTGVGGLTLGSGSGWLERSLGFVCDNLLSAQVVTADGRIVTASATENTELFWALRGGGGNFGVVTEFELQLHPVGPVLLAGMLLYPGPMGR